MSFEFSESKLLWLIQVDPCGGGVQGEGEGDGVRDGGERGRRGEDRRDGGAPRDLRGRGVRGRGPLRIREQILQFPPRHLGLQSATFNLYLTLPSP